MTRLIAGLLVAGGIAASAMLPGVGEPTRLLRVEPYTMGVGIGGMEFRLLRATYRTGRLRVGIEAAEVYAAIDMFEAGCWLPVHVGYTIWSNPKKTLFSYSMVPDVYAEVSFSPFGGGFEFKPLVRAGVTCDVDYYGLGVGIEAGGFSIARSYDNIWEDRFTFWYLGLRARLLPIGIALQSGLGPQLRTRLSDLPAADG